MKIGHEHERPSRRARRTSQAASRTSAGSIWTPKRMREAEHLRGGQGQRLEGGESAGEEADRDPSSVSTTMSRHVARMPPAEGRGGNPVDQNGRKRKRRRERDEEADLRRDLARREARREHPASADAAEEQEPADRQARRQRRRGERQALGGERNHRFTTKGSRQGERLDTALVPRGACEAGVACGAAP